METKGAIGIAKASFSFLSSLGPEQQVENNLSNVFDAEADLQMPGGALDETLKEKSFNSGLKSKDVFLRSDLFKQLTSKYYSTVEAIKNSDFKSFILNRPIYTSAAAFIGLFIIGTSLGMLTQRKTSENNNISTSEFANQKNLKTNKNILNETLNNKKTLDVDISLPINAPSPSDQQIQFLIEAWLMGKSNILNGFESEILISVARPSLFNRVIEQRKKDKLLDQRQIIEANITSIKIVQRSVNRIAADVELDYQDKRISSSGNVLSETVIPSLKVKYILGKNKNNWQVVDYISSN